MLTVAAKLRSAKDPFPADRAADSRPRHSCWLKEAKGSLSSCRLLSSSGAQFASLVSRIEQVNGDVLIRVSELKAKRP